MESCLIVSSNGQISAEIAKLLEQTTVKKISVVNDCGEARRLLIARFFDLCVINMPLKDETGEKLSVEIIGGKASQVLLLARQGSGDETASRVENQGVFTLEKPLSRQAFWTAVKLMEAAFYRLERMKSENKKLTVSLNDLKYIGRAKCLLIEKLGMTEENAHKYIEKEAMNSRVAKVEIAKKIILTYDN